MTKEDRRVLTMNLNELKAANSYFQARLSAQDWIKDNDPLYFDPLRYKKYEKYCKIISKQIGKLELLLKKD